MKPDHWRQIQQVFDAAIERPPGEREAYVRQACGDAAVLAEALSLLATYEDDPDFLESLAAPVTPSAPAELDEEMAGRRIGAYRIVRRVGEGGMGAVYLARRDDETFQQEVALKLVRRGMNSDEIVRRFRSERQILASLDHPNIARLLDGGVSADGRPYFVMEYIDGVSIDDFCAGEELGIGERLALFREVCHVVHYAHQNLVVHRDLKPSNILVSADRRVKLLDFGIAKLLDPETDTGTPTLTLEGSRPMTPEYASPEQLRNEPITTASDVYSLGVLLFELLTGERPFRHEARAPDAVARVLSEREPPRPSTVAALGRQELRGDLDSIVLKAMQHDPRERYPSAEALAEDIRHYLAGDPVSARGESVRYRAAKFVRRHRAGVAITAGAFLLVIAFGLVMSVQSARIAHQATEIARSRDRAERISGVLVDMFDVSDPYGVEAIRGDTLRVQDFLRRNEKKLLSELADEPEIQADVAHLFGQLYGNLGLHDRAVELTARGLETRRALFGESHPDIARSLDALGTQAQIAGDYGRASELFGAALIMRRETLGPEDLAVAESLNNLAVVYNLMSRVDTAIVLDRQALRIRRAGLGDRHLDVAQSLNNLGAQLYSLDRLDEAEPLFREALAIRREALGEMHPYVANTLNNLGRVARDRGELVAAREMFEEATRIWAVSLGDEHPQLSYGLYNLGFVLEQLGDRDQAIAVFRRANTIDRKSLPPDHQYLADSAIELGRLLLERGDAVDLSEAERLLRESVVIYTDRRGDGDGETQRARMLLGECLSRMAEYDEAERNEVTP